MSTLFKDLKQGHTVHVFNRKTADYQTGIVAADPSLPHYQNGQLTMIVDVPITIGQETKTYAIPETLSTTYYGDTCLCTDPQDILREVEQLDRQADTVIASIPTWEEIKRTCSSLKETLNPNIKERREIDQRFDKIENSVSKLTDMFTDFMKKLS